MRNFYCFLFFFIFSLTATSQNEEYKKHTSKNIQPVGHYVPSELEQTYSPVLTPEEMPYPHVGEDREKVAQIRSKNASRSLKINTEPRVGDAPAPTILNTYAGNNFNGSVPNDDSFAISKDSIILSVRNTTIGAYDLRGDSTLFESTLFLHFRIPGLPLNGTKFDPRAVYDPEADRFIVTYLSGTTYQSSNIVLAFSKTSNPNDGFYIYFLDGNPLQNNTWSDYPHLTVTKEDVVITMNTFLNGSQNNSGYIESTIRTIGKRAGYDSLPLTQQYFYDIAVDGKNLFNFTAMKGGSGLKGAPHYVLSNRNLSTSNDSLFLVTVTDSAEGNPELTIQTFKTENPYGLPPEARQKNNHRFDCNDCRILAGFYENNRIQFVGNTATGAGNSGIYHGILNPENPGEEVYFKIFGQDTLDYGYPNISYTGKSSVEMEAILTFNHAGPTFNSGFSAMYFGNDTSYSHPTVVVPGESYADVIGGGSSSLPETYERWGDYSGAQPAYWANGVVYASGYNANSQNQNQTVMTELRSPTYQDEPILPSDTVNPLPGIKFGPNPAREDFQVKFYSDTNQVLTFTLFNLSGQDYRQEFSTEQPAFKGNNTFRFYTDHMVTGLYYLVVQKRNGETLLEEKIVIAK